jgi:predicted NBD/HSP70 family sugar kinase
MKKSSTAVNNRVEIFKDDKLTIGLDLGDRFSHYCVLNGAGEIIREHRLPTTPKGIDEVFRSYCTTLRKTIMKQAI